MCLFIRCSNEYLLYYTNEAVKALFKLDEMYNDIVLGKRQGVSLKHIAGLVNMSAEAIRVQSMQTL